MDVKRFGASLPREEATQLIHRLKVLPFQGKVNLDQPAHVVCLHEYYGRYHALRGGGPKKVPARWHTILLRLPLLQLYLGRRVRAPSPQSLPFVSHLFHTCFSFRLDRYPTLLPLGGT